MLGPEIEMVASRDSSGRALALSNGEELREGTSSRDGWLVVTSIGANLVGTTIRGKGTQALSPATRVVIAIILNDIVFSLWRVYPTIDREVGTRIGSIVICRVGNGAF